MAIRDRSIFKVGLSLNKNMKKIRKIGDKILVRGFYAVEILGIKKGWFFSRYICQWTVRDFDYNKTYKKVGIKREWQILAEIE
jgi:hypothetical protein